MGNKQTGHGRLINTIINHEQFRCLVRKSPLKVTHGCEEDVRAGLHCPQFGLTPFPSHPARYAPCLEIIKATRLAHKVRNLLVVLSLEIFRFGQFIKFNVVLHMCSFSGSTVTVSNSGFGLSMSGSWTLCTAIE